VSAKKGLPAQGKQAAKQSAGSPGNPKKEKPGVAAAKKKGGPMVQ
jgi:hypothetical protein